MNIRDLGSMTLKIFFYLDILNCVQYNFVKRINELFSQLKEVYVMNTITHEKKRPSRNT